METNVNPRPRLQGEDKTKEAFSPDKFTMAQRAADYILFNRGVSFATLSAKDEGKTAKDIHAARSNFAGLLDAAGLDTGYIGRLLQKPEKFTLSLIHNFKKFQERPEAAEQITRAINYVKNGSFN